MERSEQPSHVYVTYGKALDNVARAFFKRNSDKGSSNVYFHICAIDGSFLTSIFVNGEFYCEYESNALTGEIVSGPNTFDRFTTYAYPEFMTNQGSITF